VKSFSNIVVSSTGCGETTPCLFGPAPAEVTSIKLWLSFSLFGLWLSSFNHQTSSACRCSSPRDTRHRGGSHGKPTSLINRVGWPVEGPQCTHAKPGRVVLGFGSVGYFTNFLYLTLFCRDSFQSSIVQSILGITGEGPVRPPHRDSVHIAYFRPLNFIKVSHIYL